MINCGVSQIAALVGKHGYKTQETAIEELRERHTGTRIIDEDLKALQRRLYRTEFYRLFCYADEMTTELMEGAKEFTKTMCEKYGVAVRLMHNWFVKQRGLILEKRNVDLCERIFHQQIFNRQRRIRQNIGRMTIMGAIDGESQSHIYEIKTRSSYRYKGLHIWERIQAAWYSHITQKPVRLIAFYGDKHICHEMSVQRSTELITPQIEQLNNIAELLLHDEPSDDSVETLTPPSTAADPCASTDSACETEGSLSPENSTQQ